MQKLQAESSLDFKRDMQVVLEYLIKQLFSFIFVNPQKKYFLPTWSH